MKCALLSVSPMQQGLVWLCVCVLFAMCVCVVFYFAMCIYVCVLFAKCSCVCVCECAATAAVKGDAGEGRWKMKVRTVMREELEQDSKAKLPPSKHQKHLESSLKDELEKAGVDPNSM